MCYLEESYKMMQKIQIVKFWERPLYGIREDAFNRCLNFKWHDAESWTCFHLDHFAVQILILYKGI